MDTRTKDDLFQHSTFDFRNRFPFRTLCIPFCHLNMYTTQISEEKEREIYEVAVCAQWEREQMQQNTHSSEIHFQWELFGKSHNPSVEILRALTSAWKFASLWQLLAIPNIVTCDKATEADKREHKKNATISLTLTIFPFFSLSFLFFTPKLTSPSTQTVLCVSLVRVLIFDFVHGILFSHNALIRNTPSSNLSPVHRPQYGSILDANCAAYDGSVGDMLHLLFSSLNHCLHIIVRAFRGTLSICISSHCQTFYHLLSAFNARTFFRILILVSKQQSIHLYCTSLIISAD